jgi:hypothetical protein
MRKWGWSLGVGFLAALCVVAFLFRRGHSDPLGPLKPFVTVDETSYYNPDVLGPQGQKSPLPVPMAIRQVQLDHVSWDKVVAFLSERARKEGWNAPRIRKETMDLAEGPVEAYFFTTRKGSLMAPDAMLTAAYYPHLKEDPGRINFEEQWNLSKFDIWVLKTKNIGSNPFNHI